MTPERYRNLRELIINKFGGVCTQCGAIEDLHLHTIERRYDKAPGGVQHLNLLIDLIVNDETAVTVLCAYCHQKVHRNLYLSNSILLDGET